MKRYFPRMSKKVAFAIISVLAIVGVSAAVTAWYPERPTYTINNPAPHVTFNSITDNPNYGDERTFFDTKDATNTQSGGFVDKAKVTDGEEVLMRVYVHNNAADNLNGANFDGKGVAKNTKVRIHLPTASAAALRANAYVTADNAQPQEVSDTVDYYGDNDFSLEYVPGSAISYTNAVPKGMKLSDSIVTTGAPIGYNQTNGVVPGCFQYTSIVTIKVKVKAPSYSVSKTVRMEGQTSADWKESLTTQPGKTVEWRIEFKNNGSTPLKAVKVVDQVPNKVSVVPGSVKLYNGNYPSGYTFTDGAVQANGKQINVNIGDYNPGINAFVLFKTKVADEKDLECGVNKINNLAYATPDGLGTVNDGADILVERKTDCGPKPVNPIYECSLITVTPADGRKVTVDAKALASNGAVVKSYSYDFGDQTSPLVTDKSTVTHTYAADGDYIIRVTVTFTVNGKTVTATSDACAKTVSFKNDVPVTPVTPTTPSELPNTGVGDVFGIFAAVTVAGAVAHRFFLSRRFGQ